MAHFGRNRMTGSMTLPRTALDYDLAAAEYCRSLPLEHFMEAQPQAFQRHLTAASFDVLRQSRPDVHLFSELLVQYLLDDQLRRVVPDNMVILSETEATTTRRSFNLELEPARPFLTIEYVSTDKKKDYDESFQKYEQELRVPYCILFDPERQDLQVYRHLGTQYERLEPDLAGRCAIGELDLQVGILDRWLRYWYQGKLLPVTDELARQIEQLARELDARDRQIDQQTRQIDRQTRQLDEAAQALRSAVGERARRHGRNDILQQLPAVSDIGQLARWLTELA
jgi:Uma2 family endonuclease